MALTAFVALIGVGFFFVSEKDTVSAQTEAIEASPAATADMLRYALNFRSATDFAVLAENGVSGSARVEGNVGVLKDGASIKGIQSTGLDSEFDRSRARTDLMNAFSAMNQLPCTEVGDAELGGKTFAAGVYCVSSARLAGEMTLDAKGDSNAVFVFLVKGGLTAESNSRINLMNSALSGNVFFASDDTAVIGAGSEFNANVLARNAVQVLGGARVTGRTVSVEGNVQLDGDVVQQTGVLQICKQAALPTDLNPPGATGTLANRIFRFEVGGVIYEAPVGGCTGPITLPVGPNTVTELTDGRFTNQPGTWSGRFRLVSVTSPTPGAGPTGTNLPLRTTTVNVREGTITNQTVLNFVNTFAVNAVIEICKRATLTAPTDPDVTGFFNFTVDALPNQVFPVPVGQCSGPIQVNVPTDPGPIPQPAVIRVTELARAGFTLESASTFPADRFNFLVLNRGIVNNIACSTIGGDDDGDLVDDEVPPGCLFTNNGGGYVNADVLEGGAAAQTTINFFNRTNPGLVKVCKIAGPGIPEGTLFRFEVRGTAPNAPAPAGPILPGVEIVRIVDVEAGPAAQGGFCDFVREADGTQTVFVVGTNVLVRELGALEPIPGVPPGEVRISRIRVNQSMTGVFVAAPVTVGGITTNPNPDLTANADIAGTTTINEADLGRVVFQARAETREAEFTNFVFNPTLLKICKIAGPGITQGTPFTFTVEILNTGGFPFGNQTNQPITVPNVTVQAGPAAQGGFCQFAQGPFDPTATTPPVGTFPVGATVRVCEAAAAGTTLTGITSPTGVPSPVAGQPRCNDLTLGFANGFNEIAFTNAAGTGGTTEPGRPAAAYDFDGDGKSDVSIYRGGDWWFASSAANNQHMSVKFGLAGDKVVAADYDGDKKTDYAVYREGIWHILGSQAGYLAYQFGTSTDIPQTGDFDGDGKADLGIYRPSNGGWYILKTTGGWTVDAFGIATDRPVAADYDGDGKTDIAVYRQDGTWYLNRSRDGFAAVQFGINADRPVPADYDGDGKADIAVYRNNGTWYMLRSRDGFAQVQFGEANDRPVPADYDGDGKTDLTLFRGGVWHMLRSGQSGDNSAAHSINFGNATDIPVPGSV
ncbi:MAG TPA: ice-binding family protein, partial [Pyrinomonadaceae bacterium]|nr:ice-binding family protein [Pyrinomonadaceae bacterium]